MYTAQEIAVALGRGKEIRQSNTQWVTCCPAHNDAGPSLSVTDSSNGRILVRCHAHCSQSDVIQALKDMDLWPKGVRKTWKPLSSAPPGTVAPNGLVHFKFGIPSKRWEYRNTDGSLAGYTYRFDKEGGGKEIVPLAYCQAEEDGTRDWRWKSFNKPRPVYNAHHLTPAENRTKPVLIVEGEKTADAAQVIFPDYVVITWAGGSSAAKFTNWEVLKSRDVTFWPDHDEPGLKAATIIAEILVTSARSMKLVSLPEELPDGWDLADDIPHNIKLDRRALVITAVEFKPSGDAHIDNMNREYSLVILGGKAVVIWEKWDHIKKRYQPEYVSPGAIGTLLSNKFVMEGRKEVSVFDYWMKHPLRKTYQGVVFEPGVDDEKYFNLWRGFTCTPDSTGDWSMLEEHLRENVAQGDESLYQWLLGWFAQTLQQPRDKPGTSLSFRGKQGSGKTVIGQHMGALVRDNYVYVDDSRYVIGNFNQHMGHALLLQADEGFFAGDPRHVGRLKGMVTADTNRIEPKGKDSFEINNYMRLMITSNEGWIVPAAFEERRFGVIDVGNGKLQNKPYFREMNRQLKDGGYEGLLHHLLNFNLSTVDPGIIPKTAALTEQKQHSLDPVAKFWFERLRDGEVSVLRQDWPDHISCEELYQGFITRSMMWGVGRRPSDGQFGRELKELLPLNSLDRERRIVKVVDERGTERKERKWCYTLPPLSQCRQSYEDIIGSKIDWHDDAVFPGDRPSFPGDRSSIAGRNHLELDGDDGIPF